MSQAESRPSVLARSKEGYRTALLNTRRLILDANTSCLTPEENLVLSIRYGTVGEGKPQPFVTASRLLSMSVPDVRKTELEALQKLDLLNAQKTLFENPLVVQDTKNYLNTTEVRKIVASVQSGNVEPFGEVYQTYYGRVHSYVASRIINNHQEAEDITAEVFIKTFNAFKNGLYEQTSDIPLEAWLFKVARNAVVDSVRRNGSRKEITLPTLPEPENSRDSTAESALSADTLNEIIKATKSFSRGELRVAYLVIASGLTITAAAVLLGKKENLVKQQLHKARKKIREALERSK